MRSYHSGNTKLSTISPGSQTWHNGRSDRLTCSHLREPWVELAWRKATFSRGLQVEPRLCARISRRELARSKCKVNGAELLIPSIIFTQRDFWKSMLFAHQNLIQKLRNFFLRVPLHRASWCWQNLINEPHFLDCHLMARKERILLLSEQRACFFPVQSGKLFIALRSALELSLLITFHIAMWLKFLAVIYFSDEGHVLSIVIEGDLWGLTQAVAGENDVHAVSSAGHVIHSLKAMKAYIQHHN